MSLEAKIEQLTAAVQALTVAFSAGAALVEPVAVAAPVAVAPAAPIAVPVFVPAPVAPVAPAIAVPFADGKGLLEWIMKRYQALGPVKGAEIQNVLVSLGYQNINDVRVESYPALYIAVEAL